MKIDRLIGILSVLLQQERITAPELAKKFEVSKRTINRDVDDLCKAGIPIQTTQGCGGGIQIMDGYRMDRTLLTSKDMQMIMAGLRSLDSVSGSQYYGQLMEKIKPGSSSFIGGKDSILIDLSSWYKDAIAPKISLIQDAIEERKYITFDLKALFHAEMKWRLLEEFGPNCFDETEEGKLLFQADYTDKENLISWLLTFGDKVVLIEPIEVKKEISEILIRMQKNYDR